MCLQNYIVNHDSREEKLDIKIERRTEIEELDRLIITN